MLNILIYSMWTSLWLKATEIHTSLRFRVGLRMEGHLVLTEKGRTEAWGGQRWTKRLRKEEVRERREKGWDKHTLTLAPQYFSTGRDGWEGGTGMDHSNYGVNKEAYAGKAELHIAFLSQYSPMIGFTWPARDLWTWPYCEMETFGWMPPL